MAPISKGEAAMTLKLPDQRLDHWRDRLPDLLNSCSETIVDLDCEDWILSCTDLTDLSAMVAEAGHQLGRITSRALETVVSASALGLDAKPSALHLEVKPKQLRSQRVQQSCCSTTAPCALATISKVTAPSFSMAM